MHDIVASEGIVLAKRGRGEANTSVVLLTKEFGVIRGSARSARLERSKLRYGLETLTAGTFSLLRGKHEWKLTGAQHISHAYVGDTRASRACAGRIARLLLRLIHGEERVPMLYENVTNGLRYVAGAPDADIELIECVLVLRILSILGYVEQRPALTPFLEGSEFSHELIAAVRQSKPVVIRAINASLAETGL